MGHTLNVERQGREHPGLLRHWTDEREVVGRSLLGIREIFGDARVLAEKYKLTPSRESPFRSVIAYRATERCADSTKTSFRQVSSSSWALLRRRTLWAVHDKQKFDSLIQDLSFFIDNLEKVVERLGMSENPNANMSTRRQSPSRHGAGEPAQESRTEVYATSGSHVLTLPTMPGQGAAVPMQSTAPGVLPRPEDLDKLARSMNGSVFIAKQSVTGPSILGTVGHDAPQGRHVFVAEQEIRQNGFGVMGNVGNSFALGLHRQQWENELAAKGPKATPGHQANTIQGGATGKGET